VHINNCKKLDCNTETAKHLEIFLSYFYMTVDKGSPQSCHNCGRNIILYNAKM